MDNRREEIREEFRRKHDCESCLYFKRPKRCPAEKACPLDGKMSEGMIFAAIGCPKDTEGGCPYGNSAGTCFGFCIKRILKEMRRAKEKRNEEQEEAGHGTGN